MATTEPELDLLAPTPTGGHLIGYARTSRRNQILDRQIVLLPIQSPRTHPMQQTRANSHPWAAGKDWPQPILWVSRNQPRSVHNDRYG